MMSAESYARQGPLAKAIIDHDRESAEIQNDLARHQALDIGWGATIRARAKRRAELSTAAAAICNRKAAPGGPDRPLAAAGGRR